MLKLSGGKAASVELSDANFACEYNEPLIHQVLTAYMAGGRSGTRAQKNRSAVSGGGAKPWRQKGSGRARAGTNRSPIWRGGGRAFPAKTRDFSQKVNRRMYRAAMRSILSEIARQDRLVLIEKLTLEKPKTRELFATLKKMDATDALLVLDSENHDIFLAGRNIPSVSICLSSMIDPVSMLSHEKVIMTSAAVKQIDEAMQ